MILPLLVLAAVAYAPAAESLTARFGANPDPSVRTTPTADAVGPDASGETWRDQDEGDCVLERDLPDCPRLTSDAREFYPTRPGDTWTYESSVRGRFTNQVTDSMLSDGFVIYRIASTDAAGREQTLMARQDGPRLYLGPSPESLALLSDFSLELGASTPTKWGMQVGTVAIAGRHATLDVFGTRFDDVVEVHIAPSAGAGLTYYFAFGIGMVGMESDHPRARVRLVTATVNGITVRADTQ
jgi:hypothetical protein